MELITETEGEFAGWSAWSQETFEYKVAGPFYFKKIGDGYISRFRAAPKHMNAGGVMHGGCLMTFADFALFSIANDHFQDCYGITVAFNCEFISGAKSGALMEAKGDVIRAGGSIVFVRGMVTADDEVVLNFSGTLKKLRG